MDTTPDSFTEVLRGLQPTRIESSAMTFAYELLLSQYAKPERHYHNLDHIKSCLEELGRVSASSQSINQVALGLWFHDSVYDPRRADNEEKSAELCESLLRQIGLPKKHIKKASNLVIATKHNMPALNLEEQLIVDIDLAIFGRPEFDSYEQAIRLEYIFVPEEQYRQGRSAILNGFLQRGHIYATKIFRQRYEEVARRNLQRSIEQLQKLR